MRSLLPSLNGIASNTMIGHSNTNVSGLPNTLPYPPAMSGPPNFYHGAMVPGVFSTQPPGMPPFGMRPPPGGPFQPFPAMASQFPPYGTPSQPPFGPPVRIPPTTTPPIQQRGPTVYIGHLTPDTDDSVVRQLLSECGRVVRWARTQDPSTKKLSTFGFCEFESPLGVIRAVRCLNGLILDGQQLVANCEDKVKDGLDQWRKDRHNKLQEENPAKSTQEIESEIEKEDQRIELTVKKIAAEYNQKRSLDVFEPQPDAEKPEPPPSTAAPLPSDSTNTRNADISRGRERRHRMLDMMEGYIDVTSAGKLSYRESQRIQKWNNRLKEARAEFRKRVQNWERKEATVARERKKAREAFEASLSDPCAFNSSTKRKLVEFDLKDLEYYLGPDGTLWEGPLGGRQLEKRAEWLSSERKADTADVEREEEERLKAVEDKKRKQEEKIDEERKRIEDEQRQLESQRIKELIPEPEIPEMKETASSVAVQSIQTTGFKSLTISLGAQQPSVGQKLPVPQDTGVVASVFGEVDEEEEHGGKKLTTVMDLHIDRAQMEAEKKSLQKKQELMAKLAAQIPTSHNELFAYPIEWDLLHKNEIFKLKLEPWIAKKVAEFLGEAEPELAAFISTRITENPVALDFLNELREFLDEDAEGFVAKLWKMLVFEVLRLKHHQ